MIGMFKFLWLILDATWINPFREKSAYKKHPLNMIWRDFWQLANKN